VQVLVVTCLNMCSLIMFCFELFYTRAQEVVNINLLHPSGKFTYHSV
jgi:hypothetical protein